MAAEIYGLEAEGTYRVNSNIDLYANFALMDGEYADDLPPGLDAALGDDLRAGACTVKPKVEDRDRKTKKR